MACYHKRMCHSKTDNEWSWSRDSSDDCVISIGSNYSVIVESCRHPRKQRREPRGPAPMCSPCLNRPRSRSSKKSVLWQMFSFALSLSSLFSAESLLCILEKQHAIKPPQAFTIMDQNRDGFIDKNDLRDTFAALGRPTCLPADVSLWGAIFGDIMI